MESLFKCNCGHAVIDVSAHFGIVEITFYGILRRSLKDKLVDIWHIIKHGRPLCCDGIVLTPKEAMRLASVIKTMAEREV